MLTYQYKKTILQYLEVGRGHVKINNKGMEGELNGRKNII